jgi:flotillin
MDFLMLIIVVIVLLLGTFLSLLSRYKKCPSDQILVIYGKVGRNSTGDHKSAKCIHGGAAFIWPIIQDYQFLSLTPISINVILTNALSRQNIRIDVPSRFTVGVSTEAGVMQNAAERLLGLKQAEIEELAKDIIFGQLRLVVATMDIEEINTDRDKFLSAVSSNVETELKKIGLRLINVNVTDIKDESGYIEALGKEAAAKAINDAKKSVAEKNRDGSIGEALAMQDQRIQVAEANSKAIEGENQAKITIANSEALRREKLAEAERKATIAERVQAAQALEESFEAEKLSEQARAIRDQATKEADIIVSAEIAKRQAEINAAAMAAKTRLEAQGQADAIFLKLEAQAKGAQEILTKQAEGFKEIVKAAGGNSNEAVKLMIAEKMEQLVAIQVDAIKNLKIDKVTVWDSMGNGEPATANFLSGMTKSIPPMNELFEMAGLELPEFLGKKKDDGLTVEVEPKKEAPKADTEKKDK